MFHVNKAVKVPIIGTSPQVLSFMNLFLSQEGQSWTVSLLPVSACSFLFLRRIDSDGTSF